MDDLWQPKSRSSVSVAANETPQERRKDDNTYRRGGKDGNGGKVVPKKKKVKEKKTYRAKADEDSTDYTTGDECDSKWIPRKRRTQKPLPKIQN